MFRDHLGGARGDRLRLVPDRVRPAPARHQGRRGLPAGPRLGQQERGPEHRQARGVRSASGEIYVLVGVCACVFVRVCA